MPEPLTQLEQRVYHYLIDFLADNTYQPSIREIARQFQIKSTKTVSDLLHALERKGYIERDQSRSRGVRLIGYAAAKGTQPVPVYSGGGPGEPPLAAAHRRGYITVDRRFLPADDTFFVEVKGDSMRSRGILDGDFVLISPSAQAKDGDIVGARLGGAATVKTFAQQDRSDGAALLGLVCAVFRPLWEREPTAELTGAIS